MPALSAPTDSGKTGPRGFRRGDTEAVQLVRDRVARILSYRGYRIPRQERADLEQEILAQLWRAASAPAFNAQGFWGFVEVVVTRRCIDWWRTRKATVSVDRLAHLPESHQDPLEAAIAREKARLAESVLARLDQRCRELLQLRLQDELSYSDISRRLGRSEQALRAQMYRCVQKGGQLLAKLRQPPAADQRMPTE